MEIFIWLFLKLLLFYYLVIIKVTFKNILWAFLKTSSAQNWNNIFKNYETYLGRYTSIFNCFLMKLWIIKRKSILQMKFIKIYLVNNGL